MPETTIPVREEAAASLQVSPQQEKRRLCPRRLTIRILTRPSFQTRTAIIVDVSTRCIGILLQERLEPGTVLALQLQGRHTGHSRILSARVLSTNQEADGNWYADCALSAGFSNEDLSGLLWEGT